MLSFNNDPKIKQKYLERVQAHAKADEIIHGVYWQDGKGCAVGCTIHSDKHSAYETELGLPEWLARLEDTLFEHLPNERAQRFPAQFLSAIPVGVDLATVKWQFCAFLLSENIEQVLLLPVADDVKSQVVAALRTVLKIHQDVIATGQWADSAARAA